MHVKNVTNLFLLVATSQNTSKMFTKEKVVIVFSTIVEKAEEPLFESQAAALRHEEGT